jgi:hypothetical protein
MGGRVSGASFEWVELGAERALRIRDAEGHEVFLREDEARELERVLPHLQEFLP